MGRAKLSVAIPLYREKQTIPELHRRLTATLRATEPEYEIIFVDDGSDDGQWEVLSSIARVDPSVRALRLARNFGLQAAATAALAETTGDAVVLMDGDLQDPPELIPTLLTQWRAGAEVVVTAKSSRPEGLLKRLAFRGFYAIFRSISDVDLQPESGLFSLMDRKVVDSVLLLRERVRFLPGLRSWTGFRSTVVVYDRDKRYAGKPQSTRKLIKMAIDGILSFSTFPLRLAIVAGLFLAFVSFMGIGAIAYLRMTSRPEVIPGWASQMVAVMFMGAIQLIFLGVVAEYLGRIYQEVKARPIFIVSERLCATRSPLEGSPRTAEVRAVLDPPAPV